MVLQLRTLFRHCGCQREDRMVSRAKRTNLRIVPVPAQSGQVHTARVTLPPEARDYYRRIEAYAKRIRNTHDVPEIIGILDEALRETRGLNGHTDLQVANERITRAECEIAALKAQAAQKVLEEGSP